MICRRWRSTAVVSFRYIKLHSLNKDYACQRSYLVEDKMKHRLSVNLGNLLLSLSDAMDLASPLLAQHQQRTAFIAWEIGKAAGLSEEMIENIFIGALLHDIGAFSVEEKLSFRNFEDENSEPHCIRGKILLERVPCLKPAAGIVRFHHREWQKWDEPIDTPLVLKSQMVSLADYLERSVDRDQYILHQEQQLVSKITSLSGKLFHPYVVDCFVSAATREEFWLDLVSPRLYSLLLHDGPYKKIEIDILSISSIAEIFQNIIDFRSRFTATHSSGVAACATILSKIFGFTESEVQLIEVAGKLHDIGKLAVPNSILEKPGSLTKEELAVIKSHTYYTYMVINTIGGLQQIAEWSAYHHERLDGSGYPFHCTADELNTGARILMVADIFTALAEDRPYRKGMSRKEILRVINDLSSRQLLDTRIVNLLFDNYDEVHSYVVEKQAIAMEYYEQQFAFLEKSER
jgi:HD-GYP domain-containing protein (c-di-GMP phosphodiesterase class II)